MVLATALVFACPTLNWEVAYSARFFKQGPAKSEYQIYMSRYDGTHKKQLTFGGHSKLNPMWLDSRHLAYLAYDRPIGNSWSGGRPWAANIVVLDVTTGGKRVLKRIGPTLKDGSDGPWLETSESENSYVGGESGNRYHVTARSVRTSHRDPDSDDSQRVGLKVGDLEGYGYSFRDPDGSAVEVCCPEQMDLDGALENEVAFRKGGNIQKYKVMGSSIDAVYRVSGQKYLVQMSPDSGKFFWDDHIYVFDLGTGKGHEIAGGFCAMNFEPGRSIWFGYHPHIRKLGKLDDGRQVWTRILVAGNWVTGKKWTIAGGLVDVEDYSIRPSADWSGPTATDMLTKGK